MSFTLEKQLKIRDELRILWSIGFPVAYVATSSVDNEGNVRELFSISSGRLRAAEFSSYEHDAVVQHLCSLLLGKLAVVKLLGKDVVVNPVGAQALKTDLKEQLGLELDTENAYLIDASEYCDKGHVSVNTQVNIRIRGLGIKGVVEIFDAIKSVKGAYPSINFTNVDPDELKACLEDY